MNKNVFSADFSTRVQTRQLDQDQQQFARLVADVRKTGKAPADEDINQVGTLADKLRELVVDLQDNGLDGFNDTLQVLSRTDRRIMAVIIWLEDQDQKAEQEEDNRTRLDQRGKKVFITMTEDDIDELPDIEYLIASILQTATVSLIYGDSNVGKTFFALHIAQCIARGLDWYGRAIRPGPVLYIYAEGIRGLKPRSQAWRKHYNADKTSNIQFIGFPVHLIEERATLINTVSSLEDQRGEKYALIVVDTFSNCAGGISQNDQMEIAKVLATAHELVRDYGAHVLVVHHTNNTGKFNGSAAFKNHVDTMIELKKPDATGPIIMRCEKQRDGEYFKDILLELQVIDLGVNANTLEPITSCVMVLSQSRLPAVEKAEQERASMLDLLKTHETLTQRKWMELCSSELSISRKPFEYHLERLKSDKAVTWTPEHPKERQAIHYRIVPTIEDILSEGKTGDNDE